MITEVLNEGDKVLVQVVKEPLGTKGARLTTQLTIASRYLVLMPKDKSIGISAKIEKEEERLHSVIQALFSHELTYGYIVRTIAEGASEASFNKDVLFLDELWNTLQERIAKASEGELIYATCR